MAVDGPREELIRHLRPRFVSYRTAVANIEGMITGTGAESPERARLERSLEIRKASVEKWGAFLELVEAIPPEIGHAHGSTDPEAVREKARLRGTFLAELKRAIRSRGAFVLDGLGVSAGTIRAIAGTKQFNDDIVGGFLIKCLGEIAELAKGCEALGPSFGHEPKYTGGRDIEGCSREPPPAPKVNPEHLGGGSPL
jgi:hypothetical protein